MKTFSVTFFHEKNLHPEDDYIMKVKNALEVYNKRCNSLMMTRLEATGSIIYPATFRYGSQGGQPLAMS